MGVDWEEEFGLLGGLGELESDSDSDASDDDMDAYRNLSSMKKRRSGRRVTAMKLKHNSKVNKLYF